MARVVTVPRSVALSALKKEERGLEGELSVWMC